MNHICKLMHVQNNIFNACTYVRFNSWQISNSHNLNNYGYEAYTIYVESKIR